MTSKSLRGTLTASFALLVSLFAGSSALQAQNLPGHAPVLASSQVTTHNMTYANANQSIDAKGRVVIVGLCSSDTPNDLPGVLTMALIIAPNGMITGGEWALNVSYTQYGPPDPDGDGDPSEVLVQRGVIKGTISTGVASRNAQGQVSAISGIQLVINGATVQYATNTTGTGGFNGTSLDKLTLANGFLSLTF